MQLVLAEDMQVIEGNTSFQEVYTYTGHLTLWKLYSSTKHYINTHLLFNTKHTIRITMTSWLVLYRQVHAVDCGNQTKHKIRCVGTMNSLCVIK